MTRRPEKLCAQVATVWDFICRAVGNKCRHEPRSSHGRTSTSIGAPGRPMIRDSCATEISVGDGIASTSSSRAWTRYLAAASRGHRGNPQKDMTYRNSANVNLVDAFSTSSFGYCDVITSGCRRSRNADSWNHPAERGLIVRSHPGPGKLGRMHHELAVRGLYGRLFPRYHVTGAGAAKHNAVDTPTHRPKHHWLLGRKSLKNGVILPTSSLKLSSKAGRCLPPVPTRKSVQPS